MNYNPKDKGLGRSIEFVFDANTNTFVVGKPKKNLGGSPHQQLAKSIGANSESINHGGDPNIVGGMFSRGTNGEIITNENSGHFGANWTPELRTRFQNVMDSYGINVHHEIWE